MALNDLEVLRNSLPDFAKDTRINLSSVLQPGALSFSQVWGVAISAAASSNCTNLLTATLNDARADSTPEGTIEDALAAASLMAMNNVFYRFRHMVGKEIYSQFPARLRMQRMAQLVGPKADFELYCLAVSAINGCETCIKSHEEAIVKNGLTEEQIYDAVRIAAVIHATAVSLQLTSSNRSE
jgi:alkyl hydroperoxide reductase subunit D